jgi:hypothetical protein
MSTSAQDVALPVPKHILVGGHKIRLRLPQSAGWAYVATTLAVAAVAAGYYLITQKGYFFPKSSWDNLFTQGWWTNYRHGIRDVGEGVLAALAVHTFITNSWKKHPDDRLSGLTLALRALLCLVLAFAAIILGVWLLDYFGPWAWHHLSFLKHHSVHSSPTAWVGSATSGVKLGSFLLGFAVTHLARRLWQPVGNTISLALLEGSVYRAQRRGRNPLWVDHPLAPPAMRERFAWIQQTTAQFRPKGDLATKILAWLTVACLPLAGYGIYILHWVAKGK